MIVNHELNSKPGSPDSATRRHVGKLRQALGRRHADAAAPCPRAPGSSTVAMPWNATGTSPPATPSAACVAPLYGTWVNWMPAVEAKSAMAMCCGLPLPPEP